MNRFTLGFTNKSIESEYTKLKYSSITENLKLTFFFLGLFQLSVGIPAIVDGQLVAFLVTLSAIGFLLIISCLRGRLGKYRQFLAFLVIFLFYFMRPYFLTGDLDHNSKIVLLMRGYAIASVALPLIGRFPDLNQKLIGVFVAFGLRFLIMGLLDVGLFQPLVFFRHVLIDCFVLYVFYSNEKTERNLFLRAWESREQFKKFKELVDNYLPQSIVVFNPGTKKCLFSNKASLNVFKSSSEATSPTKSKDGLFAPQYEQQMAAEIGYLEIDKTTVSIIEPSQSLNQISSDNIYLYSLIDQFASNPVLDYKALSVSASRHIEGIKQTFGVILTKIKWDEENAIAIVLNDITYQESLLALKIADENKDKTLATVSHELRTPLNGIIGILEMAEARVNDSQVLEYLDLCKDNAQLLLGLVNSILDFQQIKQGKLKLNVARVDITKLLKDISRLFQFQCGQKDIFLKLDVHNDAPSYIFTDENRLKQILINLVGNAIKFTFKGGITIGVAREVNDTEHLNIWVSDTGIGIKDEDKGKLFKMYGKLKDGETVNKNGVGLGLTISNALAQLLSGRMDNMGIQVESKFGEGTTFKFVLSKNLEKEIKIQIQDLQESQEENKGSFEDDKLFNENELLSEFPPGFNPSLPTKFTQCNSNSLLIKGQTPKTGVNHIFTSTDRFEPFSVDRATKKTVGTILVVDDNPFNLMVARNNIDKLGYACETANNGQEAIEKVKVNASTLDIYKVILMDQQMPILDGIGATKILREMMQKGEILKIPIVALTANNDEKSIKECLESGMSDYLQKPLRADTLSSLLSKLS